MKTLKLIAILAIVLLTSCKQEIVDLPRAKANPEVTAAVDAFIKATETIPQAPDFIKLHSVMIVKDGKVIEERWLNGWTPDMPHKMYSCSKTFTAAAVGLAVDDGLLSVEDTVIDFFPDKLPENVSDNLAAMRVKDLLTMTCGHHTEPKRNLPDVDWVEYFLAHPVPHEPGFYNFYNSYGTYMCSAIVQKLTGKKIVDYLYERLFVPMHIDYPEWDESPQGVNCGGWGLNLKTEDMAKMGQLLLQKGKWNGKQLLSEQWVHDMTTFQVPCVPGNSRIEDLPYMNVTLSNNDWMQGYGYQVWMCRWGGFRADGADGQYILGFPNRNGLIVLTTSTHLYQPYLDIVWEYLLPILGDPVE